MDNRRIKCDKKAKRVYQSIPKIKYILGTYLFENTKYTTQIIRTS